MLRLEGVGKPQHATRPDGLWSGIAEGLRFVWNLRVLRTLALIDLAVTALYLPMESVLFPKYFSDRHQPGAAGLGVDGAGGRRPGRRARLRGAVETRAAAHHHADRGAHLGVAAAGHRVPAAAAGDPGAVRGDRRGLRAHPADLQLRDADPGAAASARPGGRGDDVAGLRARARWACWWPVRWPTPPGCTSRSWRWRCRSWSSGWSRARCRRCANWTARRSLPPIPRRRIGP